MNQFLSGELKERIYSVLASAYIDEVERGTLDGSARKEIAEKVLENLDKAETYKQLFDFLDFLSSSYPFFQKAVSDIKHELYKEEKKRLLEKLKEDMKGLGI